MFIKNLKIKNFKGIENLEFSMKNINIFVGQNNTCKSTILESIALNLEGLNEYKNISSIYPKPIEYLFHRNKKILEINTEIRDIGELITKIEYSDISNISIVAFQNYVRNWINDYITNVYSDNKEGQITLERLIDENIESEKFQRDIIQNLKNKLMQQYSDIINDSLIIKCFIDDSLKIEGYINDNIPRTAYKSSYFFKVRRKLTNIYLQDKNFIQNWQEINTKIIKTMNSGDLLEKYRNLFKSNELKNILDELRKKIGYFENLTEIENELYVSIKNSEDKLYNLPLNSMGTGFKELINLFFSFSTIKTVCLLEEPENNMHPGYLSMLSEEILSKIDKTQFFITTHSMDFLKNIIEYAKNKKLLKKLQIIRLNRDNGSIEREILEKEDFMEELQVLEMDLRGY